jgi:hypothetical protein
VIDKAHWLDIAETFDSWRVVPRLFLGACFGWTVGITHELLHWYMALPAGQRGYEASGFASVVFLSVSGFLKLVFDTYSRHGRDWDAQTPQMTSTTIAQTTTTK